MRIHLYRASSLHDQLFFFFCVLAIASMIREVLEMMARKFSDFLNPSPLSIIGSDLSYKIHYYVLSSVNPLPLRCGHHIWELPKMDYASRLPSPNISSHSFRKLVYVAVDASMGPSLSDNARSSKKSPSMSGIPAI